MINTHSFTTSWRLHHYVNGDINKVETDSGCLNNIIFIKNEYDPIGCYTDNFIDDICCI